MAISLYAYNAKKVNPEMKGFRIWSAMMRPNFFDIPEDIAKLTDEWRANSATDPDKITEQKASRDFGRSIVHWLKLKNAPNGTNGPSAEKLRYLLLEVGQDSENTTNKCEDKR